MKEVISIDVKHKQKNLALRKLYFILIIHSNYFAATNGEFQMSYSTMENMGALKNNRSVLKRQLEELEKLGKIEIIANSVKSNKYKKDRVFESNKYKLIDDVLLKQDFGVNDNSIRHCKGEYNCKNCLEVCSSTLLERRYTTKMLQLEDYKKLKGSCPYNKKNR